MHLGSSCLSDRGKHGDSLCEIISSAKVLWTPLATISRGECSGLPARAVPQGHGPNPVVRGLLSLLEIIVRPAFLQDLAQILPYILHRWATKKPITVVDVMDSEVRHQRKRIRNGNGAASWHVIMTF